MSSNRTPEEVARGDIPAQYAKAVGVAESPDGQHAVVMLLTNESPAIETYFEILVNGPDGWESQAGGGAIGGWIPLWGQDGEPPADGSPGAFLVSGGAPRRSQHVVLALGETQQRVPVVDGNYFAVFWGIPEQEASLAEAQVSVSYE